ncbi:DUF5979 domain-containing protein [Lachnospiraceae bacterium CLA-AA-H246]|uniref:DUF5979 domain-containing protein n=1 Tax=Hominisplanchenecus faecis TaxID=2885351 RepID=A0ABS8EXN3_9FIRM|nr:DUF5979 domain-containing protein [Hominisplanchenecus faecis]MCC2149957.1 DUF5979 domain-containing protein [Hominisplanchenecus faecis]
MSMKKFTKKMLAIVAAGAMTMGLAMPAMAAEGTTADTVNNAKEAYISKVYNTEVGKAETFSFTATQITDGDDVIKTAHTVTIPTISFAETDLGTNTKRAKVDCGTFTEAGKYSYTVTENAEAVPAVAKTEYEELIMSKAEYRMDVYVQETTSGLEINKIIVNILKDDKGEEFEEGTGISGKVDIGDSDQNGFKFVNTYVQEAGTGERPDPTNPDTDYTTNGSLNVLKKVVKNVNSEDATAPDSNEEFDFTAEFTFPAGTDQKTLGGVKANGTVIDLTDGKTHTFKLKDKENMKFTELPVGTTIKVTEAAKANYKGSAAVVINNENKAAVVATKFNEEIKVLDKAANTGYKLGQKKNIVDVTNRFNNVPTTGIIMNTLPYVLMVALCAVALFGFVAFKRKKVQK